MMKLDENLLKNLLKNKKFFIFDLDGTLVDLEKLNFETFREVLKPLSVNINIKDYIDLFAGRRSVDGFRSFLENNDINDQMVSPEKLSNEFLKIKKYNLDNNFDSMVSMIEGASEFLNTLKVNGKYIALGTSTRKIFTDMILKRLNITSLFDLVITAEDVRLGKPDGEIYVTIVSRLRASRTDSIVFEDSMFGIEAAKDAGLFCVGISNENWNETVVNSADLVIDDYRICNELLRK
ncbi:HAD family phosphatase [Candidatus Dojkabacteria bacterium]|nr:HAD family phosphatase [Candidatus Dojkabacteria bacterium]